MGIFTAPIRQAGQACQLAVSCLGHALGLPCSLPCNGWAAPAARCSLGAATRPPPLVFQEERCAGVPCN